MSSIPLCPNGLEGRIKWKENIYEGLESAPKAFVSLFKGESIGRTLVKL
jgi:NADPH-dependent curcumin reductase CurA